MRRGQGQGAAQAGPAGVDKALSARLVPASLRCADLFPYAARSDQETLAVEVAVSPKGSPRTSRIVSGHAHEAVFDAAALACARRLQFVPARNTLGAKIEDRAVVRLRFARAS
jgi:TonB family protein